jgi:hypothetical protein
MFAVAQISQSFAPPGAMVVGACVGKSKKPKLI